MATEEIAVKITADAGQANQSVGSFKAQLREATAELVNMSMKFGEGSVQAQNAAKKVANLKDAIGDAKALADTFNPDKKFVALGGAIQGAVGGFSALQGAMALFGGESKQVEQLLLKVQSAMALQQGISAIAGSIDSFKMLGNAIKSSTAFMKLSNAATVAAAAVQKLFTGAVATTSTAFKVLKTAIISTGIGALIVLAGTLIGKIMEWNDSTEDAKKKQDELAEATKKADEAMSSQISTLTELTDIQVKRAKIAGASEAEISKIQQEGAQKRINLVQAEIDKRIAAGQSFTELSKQLADLQNQQLNQQLDAELKVAEKSRENAKNAQKKKTEDGKAAAEKAKNERKADNEAAEKQLRELRQQNFLNAIKDEEEQAKEKAFIEYDNAIKELERTKASEENKAAIRKELVAKFQLDIKAIEDKAAEEKKKKDEEDAKALAEKNAQRLKDEMAAFEEINQMRIDAIEKQSVRETELEAVKFQKQQDKINELFNQGLITQDQRNMAMQTAEKTHQDNLIKIQKDAADAEEKLDEERYQKKRKQIQQVADTIGALSEAVGKETAAGKALAVAQALINTYQGASEAIREKSILPQPFSTIQKIASVAAIIATGLKTVKSIVGVKVPGGGGGGSVPSAPSIAQAAPVLPQAQTTRIDQQQINQIGNAAVRSYVLETDVANNQERRIRIERAARIG